MTIISETLDRSTFTGCNVEELKKVLLKKCLSHIENGHIIEGNILHECKNELNYVYFESINNEFGQWPMKRYYQIVFSFLFFEEHYYNSNVIDAESGYTLEIVQSNFRGYLTHLLNRVNKL